MGAKGDLTRQKVIQSATYCLLHLGDRKTSFDLIAEHAQVSKALVVKHLKNRENIFAVVLDHWIGWARTKTIESLADAATPEEQLRNYLRVSISLFESFEFARVYLLLHYFAGIDEAYRLRNTEIKTVAVERVKAIIEKGLADGSFKTPDAEVTAKTIHSNLVGHVLGMITETSKPYFVKLPRALEDGCMKLVLT